MGFWKKIKEQRSIEKSYSNVIRETMMVSGCDKRTAVIRFEAWRQSKLIIGLEASDPAFQFITDKYMLGEVACDEDFDNLIQVAKS